MNIAVSWIEPISQQLYFQLDISWFIFIKQFNLNLGDFLPIDWLLQVLDIYFNCEAMLEINWAYTGISFLFLIFIHWKYSAWKFCPL